MKSLSTLLSTLLFPLLAFAQPVDNCDEAVVDCFDASMGLLGSTVNGTAGNVPAFCGSIEVDQWFAFTAATTGPITLTATPLSSTTGDGIQIAVYEECFGNFLACNVGCSSCGTMPQSVTLTNLTVGEDYFFLIDGWAGDGCDYVVTVDPPWAFQSPVIGTPDVLTAPATACPGSAAQFCVDEVLGATKYFWKIPQNASLNQVPGPATIELPAPDGHCAEIVWDVAEGIEEVCVSAANFCVTSAEICREVEVLPAAKTVFPPVELCWNEAPGHLLPWGLAIEQVKGWRTYLKKFPQPFGCDSILVQKVFVQAPISTNLGEILVCTGECFTIGGDDFCTGGDFSATLNSVLGCDSVVNFQVRILDPGAIIYGPAEICVGAELSLTTDQTLFSTSKWFDAAGNLLEDGADFLLIDAPGTYFLQKTITVDGKSCTGTDSIVVLQSNANAPGLTVSGGLLDCVNNFTALTATSSDPTVFYQWFEASTGNFVSTDAVFYTSVQGFYTVVITSANGCSSSAMIEAAYPDELGTYMVGQKLTTELPQPASTIAFSLANSVKNETQETIFVDWQRTVISLSPGCEVSVGDPATWYPTSQSTGGFNLGPNESGPLNLEFTDGEFSTCCGLVLLKLTNRCTKRDTLTVVFDAKCTVSATELAGFGAKIYPNPSDGHFVFEQKTARATKIEVIDQLGRVVFATVFGEMTNGFSLAGQPAGTYFAILRDEAGTFLGVERLVKQ